MKVLVFEVEIPGRVAIKKNNRRLFGRGSKRISLPSKRYQDWEEASQKYISEARQVYKTTIEETCIAEYIFYFKNHQAEPDTSNCVEGPQDLLQKMGVIKKTINKFINLPPGKCLAKKIQQSSDFF